MTVFCFLRDFTTWDDVDIHTLVRHEGLHTMDDIPRLFDFHLTREWDIPWTHEAAVLFDWEWAIPWTESTENAGEVIAAADEHYGGDLNAPAAYEHYEGDLNAPAADEHYGGDYEHYGEENTTEKQIEKSHHVVHPEDTTEKQIEKSHNVVHPVPTCSAEENSDEIVLQDVPENPEVKIQRRMDYWDEDIEGDADGPAADDAQTQASPVHDPESIEKGRVKKNTVENTCDGIAVEVETFLHGCLLINRG